MSMVRMCLKLSVVFFVLVSVVTDVQSDIAKNGFVESDGLQIYYQMAGSGPPLVLAHGWGADTQSNWVATGWIETLQSHRTVISIDIRGHGKSDKPLAHSPYSYSAMSNDVINVIAALDLGRVDFLGYSMGAFMGAYLIGHHPQYFNAVVLGGIGDETDATAALGQAIGSALRAEDPSQITNDYARVVRAFVDQNPHSDREALAFSAEQMWPEGYPLKVAGAGIVNARMPVLVVNGADDLPYVRTARNFVDALPQGSYLEIPGKDHTSVVADSRFKEAVIDFLTAHAPP